MAVKVLAILLIIGIQLYAQQDNSYTHIENFTWQYYQQGQWDSLIDLAEKAIANNIDYFYLRARVGYAYYMKGNYTKAITHLVRAREFNSDDVFVFEILYFSYVFSNQPLEANYLLKSNPSLVSKSSLQKQFIQMAYIESNISQLEQNDYFFDKKKPNHVNVKWLQANQIHSITYNAAGFQFASSKYSLSLISYANLIMDISRQIWIEQNTIDDRYRLYQHQMYFNTMFRLKKGWYLIPAVNWIMVDYETLNSIYNKDDNRVELWRERSFINNFVASLAFKHRFTKAEWDIYTLFSNLNNLKQQAVGTTFYWYPKGNLNIYLIGGTTIRKQNKETNTIVDEKFGFKVFSKMWFEQNFSIGKITNFSENYAYVIHNTTDICNSRVGASLIFPFNKFKFTLRYMLLFKSSPFDYYDNRLKTSHYDYLENSFFMNLTWFI